MDGFSKILWFTHKKYYKRSRKEVWEFISVIAGFYIVVYCLAGHTFFGIWLYASAEYPKFIIGPVFPNIAQGMRFTGIFHFVSGSIGLITGGSLVLGIKMENIQFLTATIFLLNLIVFLDILVIILQILYWDKIAAIKIIFTVLTQCAWFAVYTYRKIVKQEVTEKNQQIKLNPFHSYRNRI
uniref:Uncharacterized protein n=1 Tax=Strigamia maritima TaxID=126957 RepID=T1J9S1_STRMM